MNIYSTLLDNTPCTADANECTKDVCVAGVCNTPELNGTTCGDGNECLINQCAAGDCNTAPVTNGTACTDDGNECTADVCQNGTCGTNEADGTVCGDSNECLVNECAAGNCNTDALTDGTACTDDGDECTTDTCISGSCTHTELCPDDGLSCTLESCANNSCSSTLASDTCLIEGVCFNGNDEDPAAVCQFCIPDTSTSAWTSWAGESTADGNCDDGIDNDCDELADELDPDCVQVP